MILLLLCKDRVYGTKNMECNDHSLFSEQSARSHYRVKFYGDKETPSIILVLKMVSSAC
jgi:hypothetical protein